MPDEFFDKITSIVRFDLDAPMSDFHIAQHEHSTREYFQHTVSEQLKRRKEEFENADPADRVPYVIYSLCHAFVLMMAMRESSEHGQIIFDTLQKCLVEYSFPDDEESNENVGNDNDG